MDEKEKYIPTIGLEIHAELCTETKMFCTSKNNPDELSPNTNICPICMAHPGTLPTINKKAVEHVLRVGAAMGGTFADYSEFDRKNYFYPDIPKAYQLSQYEFPLITGGILKGIQLTRIHLEEDTARSSHTEDPHYSYVDFNRAGVPLMELVTEPEIHSAKQAGAFAREFQLLLRTLGVSHANLEKGEMRVEVNISISKDMGVLGTKVEIKNLNSFRAVEKAIDFEVQRQEKVLKDRGIIIQETRGWDENKSSTFSQRAKEEAADYRYFPEPDLPKMKLSEIPAFSLESIQTTLPELPDQKRERLKTHYGIPDDVIQMYVVDSKLLRLFEDTIQHLPEKNGNAKVVKTVSNYILNTVVALVGDGATATHCTDGINAQDFAAVIMMVADGEISSNGAVEIITILATTIVPDVRILVREKGFIIQNDMDTLQKLVQVVLNENKEAVAEYKNGKEQALKYLLGQSMKAAKGSGNPVKIQELLIQALA